MRIVRTDAPAARAFPTWPAVAPFRRAFWCRAAPERAFATYVAQLDGPATIPCERLLDGFAVRPDPPANAGGSCCAPIGTRHHSNAFTSSDGSTALSPISHPGGAAVSGRSAGSSSSAGGFLLGQTMASRARQPFIVNSMSSPLQDSKYRNAPYPRNLPITPPIRCARFSAWCSRLPALDAPEAAPIPARRCARRQGCAAPAPPEWPLRVSGTPVL